MGQGNIIGYEINEKTCQISFYNEEMAEPETMEVDADNYQIPLVIGKLRDTWAYGKEAKRLASLKEGFTVNRLLDKSLAGEKIEFGEESYEAVWLLAKFIELSLQSFPMINGIFSFMITKRVSAIICFISQKNSGSMRRRCFAVTEMRLKRICSEG